MSEHKNSVTSQAAPIIGITIGDVNGVGPEIIIKMLEDSRIMKLCTPVIYGNHRILNRYRKILGIEDFQMVPCKQASQAAARKINTLNCWDEDYEPKPGESDPKAGEYAWLALQKAGKDLAEGQIKALITAPIQKSNMPESFTFPGQTEFFASFAGKEDALMLMVHANLKVALATVHVPVEKVSKMLNRNLIFQKLQALESSLISQFGITHPKIAVLGLNPHAGEAGKMGVEEETVIGPVIREWREKGKLVFGPFAADGFFASGQFGQFDAVLAMYHDQGLSPFKIIAGFEGVNFTAGLPFLRLSPDHGTAYDLAGKGLASEQSMRSALFTALDLIALRENKA